MLFMTHPPLDERIAALKLEELKMTPESEMRSIRRPRRRGPRVSKWFGNSDFTTRQRDVAARESHRIDWARTVLSCCCTCLSAVIWVGFSWVALLVTFITYVVRMFAITGFYHRYFSHRSSTRGSASSYSACWALRRCSAAHGGRPIIATTTYSDKPEDVHSPVAARFFWSHMGWFCRTSTSWRICRASRIC